MGIYSAYGVEYAVKLRGDQYVTIVPVKQADLRLQKSQHYQKRRLTYIANQLRAWREPAGVAPPVDIYLEQDEVWLLEAVLKEHGPGVEEHGWYDVGYVSYTL